MITLDPNFTHQVYQGYDYAAGKSVYREFRSGDTLDSTYLHYGSRIHLPQTDQVATVFQVTRTRKGAYTHLRVWDEEQTILRLTPGTEVVIISRDNSLGLPVIGDRVYKRGSDKNRIGVVYKDGLHSTYVKWPDAPIGQDDKHKAKDLVIVTDRTRVVYI